MEVKLLFFNSYIDTIKNSVGSKIFQTLWAEIDGQKQDITKKGELSCGMLVSGILFWFGLTKNRHATVTGTIKDMSSVDWEKIEDLKIGAVIHWEAEDANGSSNEHIGFYIGDDKAISNSRTTGTPVEHHWTYEGKREVIAIYWHPRLNSKYF